MAKSRSKSPVVVDRMEFLLPKMEFFQTGEKPDGTPMGFYIKEIGGVHLLEFKELIELMEKEAGEDAELSHSQAIELMARFVLYSACDASGHCIFSEEDVDLLIEKSPALLIDASGKAMSLSGISSDVVSEVTSSLKNDQPVSSTTD